MASSLEILRPSPSPVHELCLKASLASDLESKSSKIVRLITMRQWNHPDMEQYLDPTWLASLSGKPSRQARKTYLDHLITVDNASKLEIVSVSTELKEKEGRASVWMILALPADLPGSVQESIVVMQWKIDGGQWQCYEQTAPRGGSGFGI